MTNEKINILFCLDHRFSLPVTVLIDSLIRNCQQKDSAETNYEMNIFLYSERKYLSKIQNYIKSHLMSKIQSTLTDNKLSLNFHYCAMEDCSLFSKLANAVNSILAKVSKYLSFATLYRLLAIDDLSKKIDKVLFLDVDILCYGSIFELYNIDVRDSYAAVVEDSRESTDRFKQIFPEWSNKHYFNAGMLLVNLSLWHTDQITKRLVDFIVSEKPLNFADQDALNYILDDKHLIYLPKKYNALIKIDKSWDKVSNNEEFPVLIHYAGYRRNKPWKPNTDLKNKWNYLYQSYMEHIEPNHKYWWALKSSGKILWSPETEKDFKLIAIHSLKKFRIFTSVVCFVKYLYLKNINYRNRYKDLRISK